jgi:hypothetical protein
VTGDRDDQRHGKTALAANDNLRVCLREVHALGRLPEKKSGGRIATALQRKNVLRELTLERGSRRKLLIAEN